MCPCARCVSRFLLHSFHSRRDSLCSRLYGRESSKLKRVLCKLKLPQQTKIKFMKNGPRSIIISTSAVIIFHSRSSAIQRSLVVFRHVIGFLWMHLINISCFTPPECMSFIMAGEGWKPPTSLCAQDPGTIDNNNQILMICDLERSLRHWDSWCGGTAEANFVGSLH